MGEASLHTWSIGATPGALAAIGVSGDDLSTHFARHQSGDWGDIDAHDRKENQLSLEAGIPPDVRVRAQYYRGQDLVDTEADRSSTCILLPEEYEKPMIPITRRNIKRAPLLE